MRAPENLGMVEAAAATCMSEDREDKAIKTMSKKDKKVQEIPALLTVEITRSSTSCARKRAGSSSSIRPRKKSCNASSVCCVRGSGWRRVFARSRSAGTSARRRRTSWRREGSETRCRASTKRQRRRRTSGGAAQGGKLGKPEEAVAELDNGLVKIKRQVDMKQSSIMHEDGRVTAYKAELTQVGVAIFFSSFHLLKFVKLEFFSLSRSKRR
jgi:structural maintenance of chromosome 2